MKSDQPVLLILTPGFPEDEADTTCLPFLQSLVKTINKDFGFIKVLVLTFQYPFVVKEYSWNKNRVISLGGKNKGKLSRIFLWKKAWKKLKEIHSENNVIGIFSVWLGECALLGKRFGRKYNIGHMCWIVGQDARDKNKYVKRIKPDPGELIAISDFIANEFYKNYSIQPLHVITNGIQPELFGNISFERTIDVIGAGSLIPLKQYDLFIDIINDVRRSRPAIKALIAGKGPAEKSLRSKIESLSLEKNISLPGEIGHAELLKLMQQAKIFLHPSSYEGFSMVCLEALYAGCHVISFCKPMAKDFCHWHVVKNKEEMVVKAVELLMNSNNHHKKVMPYSIHETSAAIMKLFGY